MMTRTHQGVRQELQYATREGRNEAGEYEFILREEVRFPDSGKIEAYEEIFETGGARVGATRRYRQIAAEMGYRDVAPELTEAEAAQLTAQLEIDQL